MHFVSRTLVFVVVILAAYWFTAENAAEIVAIDLVFLRVRASLPIVVFSSVLGGMGVAALFGWQAERRARRRRASAEAATLGLRDPGLDFVDDYARPEAQPVERTPLS